MAPVASGDPCLAALAAVGVVVGPLGVPTRTRIQPGTFMCGVLWPGAQSMPLCLAPISMPGTAMHGWVSFAGTARVAAVQLTRTPPRGSTPPGPWEAAVVAFEVPPTGWAMP